MPNTTMIMGSIRLLDQQCSKTTASPVSTPSGEETTWFLTVSSGWLEVEPTEHEVGHVDKVPVRAVAARLGPGGLEQAIEPLQDAVADVAVEPAQDALPMVHDGVGHLDHGR
jgi:hypothetical protein